jgi:hypothetical protein
MAYRRNLVGEGVQAKGDILERAVGVYAIGHVQFTPLMLR